MSVEAGPLLGSDLAGYRLESVLGRGGMGVVYLAQDLRLKRKVALKLVAPGLAADVRFRERFLREAELAASLDHSHVVPVYAAGELDGQLWMAMRYVEGEDLGTLLEREGPLEPARALELVGQVAEALDAAHEHGLVHRDVKPANALVTREGGAEHCYLADFGLARSPGDVQAIAPSHLSGTVDYTAPEQIAAEPADARADLYSLGCVLFECLTGQPPFRRDRPSSTLFAHIEEPPPSLHQRRPDLPAAIDPVIAKALAKNPDDRYQTCVDLCHEARTALGLEARRFSRRTLLLAGGGAALAAATAAAVPAALLSRGDRRPLAKSVLPLAGDSVVRIDPATGRLVAAVAAPSATWVGVSDDSVWFADRTRKRLSRVDPATNAVVKTVDISSIPRPDLFAVTQGMIWVAKGPLTPDPDVLAGKRGLWRVDLSTGAVSDFAFPGDLYPGDMVEADGSIWVANTFDDGSILRIDPPGNVSATIPMSGPDGSWGLLLAADLDGIWLLNSSSLRRIDHRTNALARPLPVDFGDFPPPNPEQGDDLAVTEEAVWFLSVEDTSVTRIDPTTGRIVDRVPVGRVPTGLVLGGGALWAASVRDATVTRIDPSTSVTETIDVGGAATSLTAGADAIWVAVATPPATRATKGPLRKGLAQGMYGGPTGFPGAERYQYPLDSAEGRAIWALRRLRQDGRVPDVLVVQAFNFVTNPLTYPFRKGAPTIARVFEEETGIRLHLAPTPIFSDTNLRNAEAKSFSLDVVNVPGSEVGTLAEAGLLLPLGELVAKHDPQWLDPVYGYAGGEPTVAKLTRYKGDTYAVGTDLDVQPYVYRGDRLDDAFEQAAFADRYGRGLRVPMTWDEQAEVAEFFTRPDADPPLYGDIAILEPFGRWGTVNWYQRFVCSAAPNLPYFADDGSANVGGEAGVRAFEELLRSLEWHPPDALEEDWTPWEAQYRRMGGCAAFGGGSFPNLTEIVRGNPQYDTGCGRWIRSAVMPGRIVDGALIRRPVAHPNLLHGVNAFTDMARQEAAYLFLQWLGGARVNTWRVIGPSGFGWDPTHVYSLDDPYVAEKYGPQPTGQLKNIIPRAAPGITIKRGPDYEQALRRELQNVLLRKRTPEQAATQLERRWNQITEQAGVETQVEALKTYFQGFPQVVDPPDRELSVEEVSTTVS